MGRLKKFGYKNMWSGFYTITCPQPPTWGNVYIGVNATWLSSLYNVLVINSKNGQLRFNGSSLLIHFFTLPNNLFSIHRTSGVEHYLSALRKGPSISLPNFG